MLDVTDGMMMMMVMTMMMTMMMMIMTLTPMMMMMLMVAVMRRVSNLLEVAGGRFSFRHERSQLADKSMIIYDMII